MSHSRRLLPRARVAAMTIVLTVAGLGIGAAPAPSSQPAADHPFSLPIPFGLGVQRALAAYCATGPAFTGKLTQQLVNSGTPSTAGRITSSTVYGWISNVDQAWSCTLYRRYSGLAWNTEAAGGVFDYGTIINSTSVGCNWNVGSTDYLKANGSSTCPTTDTSYALAIGLTKERVYTADASHNSEGDFSFVHSDCDTTPYYGSEVQKGTEGVPVNLSTGSTLNRPGANCDPFNFDSTGTSQTVTYDKTAPSIAFTQPAAGGPAVVPSAFFTVQFDASDAVAGFGGSSVWSLQRQVATWSGSACGTFANDAAAGSVVTGSTSGTGQLSGQSLSVGNCYRWSLSATDQNGNAAAAVTSGTIRTDTSGVLGSQPQLRTESWDLGAGDGLAVSVGSGNVTMTHPVVALPIRGSSVSIALSYNSQDATNVGFGAGWRLNVQRRLALNADGSVTLTEGTGARYTFTNPVVNGSTTTYTRPAGLYAALVKSGSTSFTLTYRDESVDAFTVSGSEGLLTRQQDRFGNGVTLAYVAGTNRISSITDTAATPNRTIDFGYDGSSRLTSITDWAYVDATGTVQTTATGSRRATRLFYDAASNLAGWADALDTADSCPAATVASHVTCLGYSGGMLSTVTKNLTVIDPTVMHPLIYGLPSSSSNISTTVSYTGSDVASVTDADGGQTTFSHLTALTQSAGVARPGQTVVVRPGSPASTSVYTLASPTDAYGRITSVKRKLNSLWIEERTAYDAAYPVEPDSVTQDYVDGTPSDAAPDQDVTTSYSYVANSLGLVSRMTEPLTASTHRTTDYTYNSNNDVTQKIVALDGSGTTRTVTRYCYDAACTLTGAGLARVAKIENYVDGTPGNGAANSEDVKTSYSYDACPGAAGTCGQLVLETRYNYAADGTLLDQRATGHVYDDKGDVASDIANYVDGSVASSGDDVTPNASTGARTDLTTAYAYDTAGNLASTADPRRAIAAALGQNPRSFDYVTTTAYDALGNQRTEMTPTTPGDAGTRGTQYWTFNELGGQIEQTDYAGDYKATTTNGRGLATATWEDPDNSGPATARELSTTSYDASGRILASKDSNQTTNSALGQTTWVYDELGRASDTTQASGSSPDASSTTHATYDALGRKSVSTTGYLSPGALTSTTGYDLGGRALSTDDGFTCAKTSYDYRGVQSQVVTGYNTGCTSGSSLVTTTITSDGLGRVTLRRVDASNVPESTSYDAAGNKVAASATVNGTTTGTATVFSPLDQAVTSTASDGSTTKTTFDAAGNLADMCYWQPGATVGACLSAGSSPWTNAPSQASSVVSDARNQRTSLTTRLGSSSAVATTTYDPANNYQVSAFYLPTGSGKEEQDLYSYDSRHRLSSAVHQLCTVSTGHACSSTSPTGSSGYGYDDSDNRTSVTESSDGGAGQVRNYCYDARNQLAAEKAGADCTSSSGDEVYAYDDAGNRTAATIGGSSRSFTMNGSGQLASCTSPSCSVTYDAEGRMQTVADANGTWTFAYDADGKLVSACQGSSCTAPSINRVDYAYDGQGHRTQVKETTAAGVVTTRTLRYSGDAIVQESVNGTVARTYATDDTGRIVEVCDPDCASGTVYLVVWNGHGDATGLWRQNADGTLTLANSYTYSTWGTPTTAVATGFTDLQFRFLYVGASDVQWDDSFGLHLLYMHARSYSPSLGRFLEPDPARAGGNLYAYSGNSPVTRVDPTGQRWVHALMRHRSQWHGVTASARLIRRYTFRRTYYYSYYAQVTEQCSILTYAWNVIGIPVGLAGAEGSVDMIIASPVDGGLSFLPGLLLFQASVGGIGISFGNIVSCISTGHAAV